MTNTAHKKKYHLSELLEDNFYHQERASDSLYNTVQRNAEVIEVQPIQSLSKRTLVVVLSLLGVVLVALLLFVAFYSPARKSEFRQERLGLWAHVQIEQTPEQQLLWDMKSILLDAIENTDEPQNQDPESLLRDFYIFLEKKDYTSMYEITQTSISEEEFIDQMKTWYDDVSKVYMWNITYVPWDIYEFEVMLEYTDKTQDMFLVQKQVTDNKVVTVDSEEIKK